MLFSEDEIPEDDLIVGVLTVGNKDYPALIYFDKYQLIIRSCQDTDHLCDGNGIKIDLMGLLESKIVPHPSASIEDEQDIYTQAMIIITYLEDLFDNESNKTITFSGIRDELTILKGKIDSISNELKSKVLFEVPDLSVKKKVAISKCLNMRTFKLINGPSCILENEEINDLRLGLPGRMRKLSWERIFNSNQDGFSFRTLYYSAGKSMPLMLLIKANDGVKFGAYLSCGLKQVKGYSGNGETFVFYFKPSIQIFHWTKANTFFVSVTNEELTIGGGKGAAIFLTDGLRTGISDDCLTFNSPSLSNKKHFVVKVIELWRIIK